LCKFYSDKLRLMLHSLSTSQHRTGRCSNTIHKSQISMAEWLNIISACSFLAERPNYRVLHKMPDVKMFQNVKVIPQCTIKNTVSKCVCVLTNCKTTFKRYAKNAYYNFFLIFLKDHQQQIGSFADLSSICRLVSTDRVSDVSDAPYRHRSKHRWNASASLIR